MTLKEFLSYTNMPYESLPEHSKKFVDVIDYAEAHNLKLISYHSRGHYITNINRIYELYARNKDKRSRRKESCL